MLQSPGGCGGEACHSVCTACLKSQAACQAIRGMVLSLLSNHLEGQGGDWE